LKGRRHPGSPALPPGGGDPFAGAFPAGDLRAAKQELRRELRRRLRALSPELFCAGGLRAAELLSREPCWREARTALLFISGDREIDTAPLLEAALEAGKAVFAPKVRGEELVFWRVPSPAGPWERGPFGLREPVPSAGGALERGDFPALILTPGLGFAPPGNRLGRGGGYYDRLFARLDAPPGEGPPAPYHAVGLCLALQVLPLIPTEPGDRPLEGLCTEEAFIPLSTT
jgi:5-formyltetrahydrofolate cyclo-ligase